MKNNKYINRKIETIIKKSAKSFSAIAVTGPRQSGKTTLLKNLFPKYSYFSFDDPIIREQAVADPNLFLENCGKKVIIDEIQYVPQLLSYIKQIIDDNRQVKGKFILTGSQRFNLIKSLGDSLAGRIALFELLSFSHTEKKEKKGITTFINSCIRGSYPEPYLYKNINPEIWYASYLQTYIERDIRTIYDIGNLREFQNFMKLLAARCSQLLNLSSLAVDIGVSVNTIKRWISILEASGIIFLLPPFYNNFGKRIVKSPKVYFLDCGLVCYLMGIKDKDFLLNGPFAGALFENYCIQEVVKYFYNSGKIPNIFFSRTNNGVEVDLIIESSFMNVSLIEIKSSKTLKLSMADNIKKFSSIFNKLNIKNSFILSLSEKNMNLTEKVKAVGLNDFFNKVLTNIY